MATPSGVKLFAAQVEEPDLLDMIKNISTNSQDQVRAVLEFARTDLLVFLKSYTNVYRPPRYQRKFRLNDQSRRIAVDPGDRQDWRPAHPGGWADVENTLRDNYYVQLNWVGNAWQLLAGNRAPEAVFVEAMDGYFVVSGVMEPRGPVGRSIAKAVKALGIKNWKITGGAGPLNEPGLLISPKSGQPISPDLSPWR